MHRKTPVLGILAAISLTLVGCGSSGRGGPLEGTYRLSYRERPDGTIVQTPRVLGLHSLENGVRQTTVLWQDDRGRPMALAYGSDYEITKDEYRETPLYVVEHQGSTGETRFNYTRSWASTLLTKEDGITRFEAVNPTEREMGIEFEYFRGGFRAIVPGIGVDHWERID